MSFWLEDMGGTACLEGKKSLILDVLHFKYLWNIQVKIPGRQLKMVSQILERETFF